MFDALDRLIALYRSAGQIDRRTGRLRSPSHVAIRPPATEEDQAAVERELGHPLPAELTAFLRRYNGVRLFVERYPDGVFHCNPCLFGTMDLQAGSPLADERLMIIGQLDDEAYLYLDRSAPADEPCRLYWADELDSPDEILAREPIARGIEQFLEQFIEAEGEWYWTKPKPLHWVRESETLWRHGYDLYLTIDTHPFPMYRIGLADGLLVAPAARIAAGLRDHLLSRGCRPVDPRSIQWDTISSYWLLRPASDRIEPIEPSEVGPATSPATWGEVAPGLWLHRQGDSLFWRRKLYDYSGRKHCTYVLSWQTAEAHPLDGVISLLNSEGGMPTERGNAPDGYDVVTYSFLGDGPRLTSPDWDDPPLRP